MWAVAPSTFTVMVCAARLTFTTSFGRIAYRALSAGCGFGTSRSGLMTAGVAGASTVGRLGRNWTRWTVPSFGPVAGVPETLGEERAGKADERNRNPERTRTRDMTAS